MLVEILPANKTHELTVENRAYLIEKRKLEFENKVKESIETSRTQGNFSVTLDVPNEYFSITRKSWFGQANFILNEFMEKFLVALRERNYIVSFDFDKFFVNDSPSLKMNISW